MLGAWLRGLCLREGHRGQKSTGYFGLGYERLGRERNKWKVNKRR